MIPRDKLEHILEYARQQKQSGAMACRVPPGDMVEIMELLLAAQEGNHADIVAAAEKLARCKGRYHSEQNYRALAALFGVTVPDLEPMAGDGNFLAVPNGWKLVPEDADQNMIDAAYRALDAGVFPGGVYADMIATAPLPPVPGGDHG